jgi:hypothetical protein
MSSRQLLGTDHAENMVSLLLRRVYRGHVFIESLIRNEYASQYIFSDFRFSWWLHPSVGCYIVWMWAMLSKFSRYILPPSSGSKFVGARWETGRVHAREYQLPTRCLISSWALKGLSTVPTVLKEAPSLTLPPYLQLLLKTHCCIYTETLTRNFRLTLPT